METTHLSLNKIQAFVLQPTSLCNINCHYCYLPDRMAKHMMTSTVLARILEELFSSFLLARKVTMLWHAGEPLVVSLDFYREVLALVERFNTRGITVIPSVQTNGMLITQQWCDFIKQHRIQVGVSLDGPQHIHDRSRVDRAGKGTFERAMRGVKLLQQNGIEPSIIMVLTKYALDYPDEIWQFFYDHHLTNLSFNIEEVNGAHTRSSLDNEKSIEDKYKAFLRRILELRESSLQPPFVREIDVFMGRIHNLRDAVRSQENVPGALVSFDYAGNVSTFSSELLTMTHARYSDFLLGNIFDGMLADLLTGQKLLAINKEVQHGVTNCQLTCDYFNLCGGGSPANKFSEHGTLDATETLYCKLKIKATVDVMVEHLERRYLPS